MDEELTQCVFGGKVLLSEGPVRPEVQGQDCVWLVEGKARWPVRLKPSESVDRAIGDGV